MEILTEKQFKMISRTEWLAYFQILLIFSTLRHVDAVPIMEVIKLRLWQALSKAGLVIKVTAMTGESLGESLISSRNVPLGLGGMVSALFTSAPRDKLRQMMIQIVKKED